MRHKSSAVSDPNSFVTSAGDKFHVLYDPRMREDGTIELREGGRENIQDKINSFASQCDMALIISRLQMGDTSVIQRKKPMYGDFTQFPKTYAECLDLVNRSNEAFEALSPEVKAKFDNDKNKWFASIGSENWMLAMGLLDKSSEPVSEPSGGVDNA